MAKSMKGTNPMNDSGFDLSPTGVGFTVLQYTIWFVVLLASAGAAIWAYSTGKEATGMDGDVGGTITVK